MCFPEALAHALDASSWMMMDEGNGNAEIEDEDHAPQKKNTEGRIFVVLGCPERWRTRTVMALCLLDRNATPAVQREAMQWLEERPAHHGNPSLVDRLRVWWQSGGDHGQGSS